MKVSDLKKGSVLSELQFYRFQSVDKTGLVTVLTDDDQEVTLSSKYVEQLLTSADSFGKEEDKTMTELAELFISSPRVAMTVAYKTKDEEKKKKDYETEKAELIQKIANATVGNLPGLLNDFIENPLTKVIPGTIRVMKGRHYGKMNELGRITFIDMEETKNVNKGYDSRTRLVDPRTISYLIIEGVKYNLKK